MTSSDLLNLLAPRASLFASIFFQQTDLCLYGAGGAWGVLATGLFATAPRATVSMAWPNRCAAFFGGAWHQLVAQAIGCLTGFAVVYLLGYMFFSLVQKILGLRVDLADEIKGLDWRELGALGYRGDAEVEETDGKS